MYIFTGDRITGALYAQQDKEIDDRTCFFGSRLTFEESDGNEVGEVTPFDPSKNTACKLLRLTNVFRRMSGNVHLCINILI